MTHTPTPWKLGKTEWDYSTLIVKDDKTIARLVSSDFLNAEADAAFIVRAVNAHEELLAVVKSMRLYIDTFSEESKANFRAGGNGAYVDSLIIKADCR